MSTKTAIIFDDVSKSLKPLVLGEHVYYYSKSDYRFCRAKLDGSSPEQFANLFLYSSPFFYGGYIYFVGSIESGKDISIRRIKPDGTDGKQYPWRPLRINDVFLGVFVSKEYMYFCQENDGKVARANVDGNSKPINFPVSGQPNLYYTGKSDIFVYLDDKDKNKKDEYMYFRGTDNKLWRMKTDGTDVTKPRTQQFTKSDIFVNTVNGEQYMYFQGDNDKLLRVKADGLEVKSNPGQHKTKSGVVADQNYIYFRGLNDEIWRVTHSGVRSTYIGNKIDTLSDLAIDNGYIYFRDVNQTISRIQVDTYFQQSPIELRNAISVSDTPDNNRWLKFGWRRDLKGKPKTDAHGALISFEDEKTPGEITVKGKEFPQEKKFEIVKYHLHSPAEHIIEGDAPALFELHIIHKNTVDGRFAVLGITFNEKKAKRAAPTAADQFFRDLTARLTGEVEPTFPISTNPWDLLPKPEPEHEGKDFYHFYRYEGSLTSEPYSENVSWFVLKKPTLISADVIRDLQKVMNQHARPVQPLNRRFVLKNF